MKGILLAGGTGSRLYPLTRAVSKQLLPLYDKPMIYYPLSVLLLAGIREILLISTPGDLPAFRRLLGDGSRLGVTIEYKEQPSPRGIPDAFILGEDFIQGGRVFLILGDNFFFGQNLTVSLRRAMEAETGAAIFGYPVKNPSAYGVAELDEDGNVISIQEKPEKPASNLAVPGMYLYDNQVVALAKELVPSARGELEITEINNAYLKRGQLRLHSLGRGMAWLDTGTPAGMLRASEFVETVQLRQGFYISCIEEIAWRRGFIGTEQLRRLGEELSMTDYGQYLMSLAETERPI